MNKFAKIMPLLAAAAVLPTLSGTAHASEDDRLHGYSVIGVAAIPEYEGADKMDVIPFVNGRLTLGERYIAIEGVTLRANVLATEGFEFGPVANLTFGRDAKIKSNAVARLGKIDEAYEIGGFAAASFAVGENGRARFAVQAVHDVSNVHDGWVATASARYSHQFGKRFTVGAEATASYADDKYAQTYYSVTPVGALASGLPQFAAKGGLKDVGATLTASYQVTPRWSINAYGGYRRMLGKFADSPVVDREGNANQLSAGIGIGFAF